MDAREYEDYLASFDDAFAEAPTPVRGASGSVPDGKYQVKIDKVQIRNNVNTQATELAFQLKVLNGEHAGRIIFHQRQLDDPERMSYLRGDLHVCGVEISSLSQLPRSLENFLDIMLEVQVKSKTSKTDPSKSYQNVYLNKRITDGGDMDGANFSESDLPF